MTTTTVTVVEPPASIYKCTVTTPHQSPEYQSDGLTHRDGYEEVSNGKITSVTDYEGNVYPVVQIGSQCWIAENLRCQYSPNTGSNIVTHNGNYNPGNDTNAYYKAGMGKSAHWYHNNPDTYAPLHYGLLYNFCAAMDIYPEKRDEFNNYMYMSSVWNYSDDVDTPHHRGICPKGWHIPTHEEWTTLKNNEKANQAVKLAGDGWPDSQSGYCIQTCPCGTANRNLSGFTALPAGHVQGSFSGTPKFPQEYSEDVYFWNTTVGYASMGKASDSLSTTASYNNFHYLYSVRCIRDTERQP